MFRNYLKSAIRNLSRHKLYTLINIFGLALGLAVCLVVVGLLSHETSFENIHGNKDRIYRIETTESRDGDSQVFAAATAAIGNAVAQEVPEVESAAVFRVNYDVAVTVDRKNYRGGNLVFANPEYLRVFTLPLIRGDAETALREPMSVLVTQETIDKYFSGQDPVGSKVVVNNEYEFTVRGVLEDIPANTQLDCEFIASHSSLDRATEATESSESYGDDFAYMFFTDYVYLLMREGSDPSAVEPKLQPILSRFLPPEKAPQFQAHLKPLRDIYFSSYSRRITRELEPRGEASFIFELGMIAAFILILAIVNFINLSTARTSDRQKEVGLRKVFGAARTNLVGQFLGESAVVTTAATVFGIILYEIFKARLQDLLPRPMFADFYESGLMVLLTAGLLVVVSVLAGFYPALYLSRFQPVTVLQGKASIKSTRSILRKTLVVLQFVIAIVFVTGAVIMSRQVNHVASLDMGFDRENILVLDFEGEQASDQCALMMNQILSSGTAVSVTALNDPPGRPSYSYYRLTTDNDDTVTVTLYKADEEFLSTFGMDVIQGQGLSGASASQSISPVVVTSSVAQRLVGNPIGQTFRRSEGHYEIVGVIEDFYGGALDVSGDASMCVVALAPQEATSLAVKLRDGDVAASVAVIENLWQKTLPGVLFNYSFLDDEVARGLDDQRGQQMMFLVMALFSIVIASLGIVGLVSFTAEQRTKEIGVRKVLGASVGAIVTLLSREFLILIAIANLIAWPIAYLMISGILQQNSVRITIGPGTFLLAGFISLLIAFIAAGSQALRAAVADPITTLRRE